MAKNFKELQANMSLRNNSHDFCTSTRRPSRKWNGAPICTSQRCKV